MGKSSTFALAISMGLHVIIIGAVAGVSMNMPAKPVIRYELAEDDPEIRDQAVLPEIRVLGYEKQFKKQEEVIEQENVSSKDSISQELVEAAEDKEPENAAEADSEEAMLRYQDMIKQRIEKNRKYPLNARKRNTQGITDLRFTINRSGYCTDVRVIRSSESELLDAEAVNTIKRSQPFAAFPEDIRADSLTIHVAIVFSLK